MNRYKRIRQWIIETEQEIAVLGAVTSRNRGRRNLKSGRARRIRGSFSSTG